MTKPAGVSRSDGGGVCADVSQGVDGLDSWVTDNLAETGGSTANDGFAAMEVNSLSDDNTDCQEGELIKSNSSSVVSNSSMMVGVVRLFASATWVCETICVGG